MTIRVTYSAENETSRKKMNKLLSWCEKGVVILTVSIFTGFIVTYYIIYDPDKIQLTQEIAIGFLALFLIMGTVNMFLFRALKKQLEILGKG